MVGPYNTEGSLATNVSSKKAEFDKRFDAMKTKAEHYMSSYRDLATYLNPTRGLFDESMKERGKMIDHKVVLDAHATGSIRKTASGLNSGITSKSRPWFRLTISDENLSSLPQVRLWLDAVQKQMYFILRGSNIYGAFQNAYEELLTFGTACFIMLFDMDTIIRARSFTAGEYFLAVNKQGKIDSYARTFELTVAQLISEFGYANCTPSIQSDWDNNYVDSKHRVRHLIEPNDNANAEMDDFKNMPFRSAYWVQGDQVEDKFLEVRGFKRFPVVAPRWLVPTTDIIYGFGPGWDALGDVKELQKTKYDKLLAQAKLQNPPVMQDASVVGSTNLLPGGVTKTSATVPNVGVRPTYQIPDATASFINSIAEIKANIDRHFFTDLFTMLAALDRGQMTAREVAAREQERIMLMGPILNQLDEEMLSKVIEILFGIMQDNNMLPPAPPEIEGMDIKVQYISILAQMQESTGTVSIEKVAGYVGNVMGASQTVGDVFNWDESVREYARMEGIPEKLLNDPNVIKQIREQRAQMQQGQMALATAESGANTAKTLSETQMGQGSALDSLRKSVGR